MGIRSTNPGRPRRPAAPPAFGPATTGPFSFAGAPGASRRIPARRVETRRHALGNASSPHYADRIEPSRADSVRGAAPVMPETSIVSSLMDVIAARKSHPPAERSYVVSLLQAGIPKIGAKIVEEAGEVVEAAAEPGEAGRAHLVHEVADLLFHTLVMLGPRDIPWSDVEAELARRFGVSGIVEKASRGQGTPPPAPAP